jgi:CTP:molybdopterin cytidylyltransferase MocA
MGMSSNIGCAVLAAGRSQRLGRPKQLVSLAGEPLVRRIAQVALASDFGATAVVVGCHAPEVEAALAGLSLTLLPNPDWEEGMASSIRTAVRWAEAQALGGLVLVTCDQWRLDVAHLTRLKAAVTDGRSLAASKYGRAFGIPAAFGSGWYPRLAGLRGEHGAGPLLAGAAWAQRIDWPAGTDDLDTEADLARASAQLR